MTLILDVKIRLGTCSTVAYFISAYLSEDLNLQCFAVNRVLPRLIEMPHEWANNTAASASTIQCTC